MCGERLAYCTVLITVKQAMLRSHDSPGLATQSTMIVKGQAQRYVLDSKKGGWHSHSSERRCNALCDLNYTVGTVWIIRTMSVSIDKSTVHRVAHCMQR